MAPPQARTFAETEPLSGASRNLPKHATKHAGASITPTFFFCVRRLGTRDTENEVSPLDGHSSVRVLFGVVLVEANSCVDCVLLRCHVAAFLYLVMYNGGYFYDMFITRGVGIA